MARKVKRVSSTRKATKAKSGSSFHSKPAPKRTFAAEKSNPKKSNPKKSYTSAERRSYWIGVGYQAGAEVGLGMRADKVTQCMTGKEKASFTNGRMIADDLTAKFVPDLAAGQAAHQRARKRKRK